jgi:hypothetical protein
VELQRIILESSAAYVLLCLALAAGLTYLLYTSTHPWSKQWNYALSATRFVLIFLLSFLLLGPIIKQVMNRIEKPVMVILRDNSSSIAESVDSTRLNKLEEDLALTHSKLDEAGYQVATLNLAGEDIDDLKYNADATDLNSALKKISYRFEGQRIGGVILASDGIFNKGLSPLYANYNFPIYSVGVGDTVQRTDAGIRSVVYNRIAYQGNKFPVRAEVFTKNLKGEPITVSLRQGGKVLERQTKTSTGDDLLVFDFYPVADEQGIQKLDIQVDQRPNEFNVRNNASSAFVEVVEGKKKILIVAPSPHPDLKAIREVIEKNSNYESFIHIPGMKEIDAAQLRPDKTDLVIFHQAPDLRGKTLALFQQFLPTKTSMFIVIGQQSDLRNLSKQTLPIQFEGLPRDYDQVTPVVNAAFGNFTITPETNSMMTDYPPATVHFGRMKIPMTATPLLFQRVGSLATEKPMLAVDQHDGRKVAVMLGEGLWRWRLNEFDRTEKTDAFDELFGKLIQYLSTTDDKRKFRSNPVQQEFSDTEPVIFESQVYNDIFEPVFGNTISIDITDDKGKRKNYSYITSPGNSQYQIGGLDEGVYRYKSSTTINGAVEETRGQFAVLARNTELLNLTADFDLLRSLSAASGGKFVKSDQVNTLTESLVAREVSGVIHSEESYNSLINLKWVFWILVAIIALEWFGRKFFGSY